MGLELAAPDHTTLSRRGRQLVPMLRRTRPDESLHLIVDSTGLSIVDEGEWARSEYFSCPPRLPTPAGSQVATAAGENQIVTSPRRTRARS